MSRRLHDFPRKYEEALRLHLQEGGTNTLVRAMSREALASGIKTLEMAKLHERIILSLLLPDLLPRKRAAFLREAGSFFANVTASNDESLAGARKTAARLTATVETLSQRTVQLSASNLELNREIKRRKEIEGALRTKERHNARLLKQAESLHEQLRNLSRQIITAQEDERKAISRELHDIVVQTLTGINLRLATLKKQSSLDTKGLDRSIASTQRLVEKSVNIVHQFARELRPAVLDHLGLIPALHSYMKAFTERTGVRTHLTAFAAVEELTMARRTVLFRVAQEALTNVARHAQATRVEVTLARLPGGTNMTIKDDGKSFRVDSVMAARGSKRLGMLGMRERLEMVGGSFEVESTPEKGTCVTAHLPFAHATGKLRKPAGKKPSSRQ